MKKICIKVSPFLGAHGHGVESHIVKSLSSTLLCLKYKVDLVGYENGMVKIPNVKYYNYIYYGKLPLLIKQILHIPVAIINLFIYCSIHKPDLIFSLGANYSNGLASIISGKIFKIKTLCRAAEDYYNNWKYADNIFSMVYFFFSRYLISIFVLKKADFLITPGKLSCIYFKKKLKKKNIFYFYGPIQYKKFFSKKLKEKKSKKIILFVGVISILKSSNLYEIIKKLLPYKKYKFLIIGSIGNKSMYNRILQLDNKNIIIKKPVANEKLNYYFNQSKLLIFLTKTGVGMGIVNFEAATSGLPILSLNPKMDVKEFLGKKSCANSVDSLCKKIIDDKLNTPLTNRHFSEKKNERKILKIFKYIMSK